MINEDNYNRYNSQTIARLEAEVAHWKANHDQAVKRKRKCAEASRERIAAMTKQQRRLEEENEQLRNDLAFIIDQTGWDDPKRDCPLKPLERRA